MARELEPNDLEIPSNSNHSMILGFNDSRRFRLDIRKKYFMIRVVKHWHRFPTEKVDAPFLEMFEDRLDRSLSCLIELKMSLVIVRVLGYRIFKGPLPAKSFYDVMKSRNRVGKL